MPNPIINRRIILTVRRAAAAAAASTRQNFIASAFGPIYVVNTISARQSHVGPVYNVES
jgi:hypothetical protein